jgi:hypothetical protein
MNGIELILAERQRQISVEGWTPQHDAQYKNGELAVAADCYWYRGRHSKGVDLPDKWPWSPEWWKPTPDNRIKEITKAGALYKADFELTGNQRSEIMIEHCAKKINQLLSVNP